MEGRTMDFRISIATIDDQAMYLTVQLKLDIGKFPHLGFWNSYVSPQNWTVFNCYLLNKHPTIRLHEKKISILGRIWEK